MIHKTTSNSVYVVGNTNKLVTLDLIVAPEGQTVTSTIELNNVVIDDQLQGSLFNHPIGTNAALKGKRLIVATTVSNTTSTKVEDTLAINLKGGILLFTDILGAEVASHKSQTYYIEIDLTGL